METSSSIHLGRIVGVDVVIDWSLLIIFTLITFSLAAGLFPAWHPDWGVAVAWLTALAAAILFFASVLIHELSHALVGRLNGIDVQRITLFMFGGMAHMENEPLTWKAEFAMAIIGPITSLVLGFLFLWLADLASGSLVIDPENPQATLAALSPLSTLLLWLGPVNIILALFNMVPGFPLDGGRVLRALLWGITGDQLRATRWASAAGQGFAWLLVACGVAMLIGLTVPFFGRGLAGGLWLILIGWFLHHAARMDYRQLLLRQSLGQMPVARLMQTQLVRIDPQLPVGQLVEDYLMASGQRVFPVEANGRLLGLVTLRDIYKNERGVWDQIRVEQIMTPRTRLTTVSPRQEAFEALSILGRENLNQMPVIEGDHLLGMIHREDVLRWLFLHRPEQRKEWSDPPRRPEDR